MRAPLLAVLSIATALAGCVDEQTSSSKTPGTPSRNLAKTGEPCGGIAGIICDSGLRCAPLVWPSARDPRAPGMVDELGRCVPEDAN